MKISLLFRRNWWIFLFRLLAHANARVTPAGLISILFLVAHMFYSERAIAQSPYTSVASGPWDQDATWSGVGVPVAGNTATIASGHVVTVSAANAACATLNVNSGGTLTVANGFSLTVSGTTTVTGTGVLTNDGTVTSTTALAGTGTLTQGATGLLNIGGTSTITTLTATAAGNTVNYNSAAAQGAAKVTTYSNLTLSGGGAKTFATTPTVNGVLSLEGTASVVATVGVVTYGASATLQYNKPGNYTSTAEEWITPFLATGGVIIANTGDITMNGAKVLGNNTNVPLNINTGAVLITSNNALTLHGDFTNDGTLTAGSSNITLTGTFTPQSIGGFTTTGTVSMTKSSGTAAFTDDVNGGGLTINGLAGTLDLGTGLTHTFSGTWTRSAGTLDANSSTLRLGGSIGGLGLGTFTAGTSTVEYYAGAQACAAVTYNNLTLSGTGNKTFATTPTVNGILSMAGTTATPVVTLGVVTYGPNATLQYNKTAGFLATAEEWITPFLGTGGVIIANTGAITQNNDKVFGNSTNVPLNINTGATLLTNNNDLTFHGDFINDGTLTAGSSDIVLTGTFTPQSIDGFTTTAIVSMTKSSGTATLNGDVNGASLVINGTSGTLDLGSGLTHTFTGDWTRTAGIVNGGSSTLNIGGNVVGSGGTFTAGTSTVDYTGAAQTTAGVNYYNLTFSGSGAKTLAAGTTAIGGDFTMSGTANTTGVAALTITGSVILGTGTSLTAGSLTHNITGDWSNNGGTFTGTGSTINFNGADQSIGGTGPTTFNNLTLAGSGIKTIGASPTINGNLTLSGTATTSAIAGMTIGGTVTLGSGTTFTAGSYTHNVAGNWTNNGGNFNNAGSTINFNGAAQAIGGTSSTTFNSISLAGTGTKTFNIGTATADRFTINTGAVADLGTFAHTTNTLRFDAVAQAAGTWGGTGSGATNINTTFFAAATGILTVAVVGSTTYYSRQSGNWNATTTWSTVTYGNATNTGTFPVAGDIVNIGGGNFTITVNVNSACTLISFLGGEGFDQTVSLNAAGRTLNVSGVINLPTGSGFGDTNTIAVGAGTLNVGGVAFTTSGILAGHQITISTGTATISGDVTQSGLNPASIVFSSNGLLQLGGDLPNYCSLTPSTGTVEYFGTGSQNVSTITTLLGQSSYYNLAFSGSGVKTAGGDTDINNVFTLGSGTSFIGGPYIYTLGGNWVNNGTTFTNTNFTVTLDGGAQSIGGTSATTFNNLTLSGGTKAFSLITTINGLLSINTGALANLGSITTHFARSLALAGAGVAAGSWGSTASAATNKNNTYFTAGTTGILNVSNRAYYSKADGNWNAAATWSTVTYDNATNTGTWPVNGDIANIGGDGYTITVNAVSNCGELNFEGNTGNDNFVNMSSTLNVSGAINIPNGGFGGVNTIAVGTGTLNAASIEFSTEGLFALGTHSLTISTGSVNVSGDVSQSGGSDATITFSGSGQLNLGGAFLNSTNCAFTASTSTVTYQGSVAQTIGDFTYYNLTLNNTSGSVPQLTLYDDATVSHTLTMTAGIINLNSSTLQLGTSISIANNGTLSYAGGWMYGGTFRRYFNETIAVTLGTVSGLFPLGTSSNYRPLYLGKNTQNNSGGALNVSHDGTNNGSSAVNFADDNGTVVMRSNSFWTVSKATGMSGTGTPYSIQAGGTGFGTIQEVDDLRLTQAASEVGTTSLPNGGTTSSPLVQKINISNAALARNYYIGSVDGTNTPLPVSLLFFRADLYGSAVTTTWSTAQELNNAFFTVERASDIENFEAIGEPIAGAGTTKVRHDYNMIDENPLYGRSYYRLKQTDFDGKYSYSNVQVVDYEGPSFASLRAYPNPSDGTRLTVVVRGLKEQAAVPIQIYNVQGQMVYENVLDVNTPGTLDHEIEFGNPLKAGVYLIKAGPTLQLTQKIFIH